MQGGWIFIRLFLLIFCLKVAEGLSDNVLCNQFFYELCTDNLK